MRTILVAILTVLISTGIAGQSFEVASIKLHVLPVESVGMSTSGMRLTATAMSLTNLIVYAYDLQSYQVSGGPGWMSSDRWDIAAKAPGEAALTKAQTKRLLQTLLADRFQVVFHREMREMPVLALTIGKKGPALKENNDPNASYGMSMSSKDAAIVTSTTKGTMEQLASSLSVNLGRPVANMTGLTRSYDYKFDWIPGDQSAGDSNATSIFTAIQEQLGLKLESTKRPIEILIVDRVERPSGN